MAKLSWTSRDLPDLRGRRIVLTGGTDGVGAQAAVALSAAGASLVLPIRNRTKAAALANRLTGPVELVDVDLSSLASVRAAAASIEGPIDVLINNAGALFPSWRASADGIESTYAVNFLGPFALTGLLIDQVRSRVVIMTSNTAPTGRLDPDPRTKRRYRPIAAYAGTKLADMLWAFELDRRLVAAKRTTDVMIAHPGWATTNIQNVSQSDLVNRVFTAGYGLVAQSAAAAALPLLFAATQPLPRCSLVGPDRLFGLRGSPTLVRKDARTADPAAAAQAWREAERLSGVTYPV